VAGALAERVFVDKMVAVGFCDVEVLDRQRFGLADAARYPLFTDELIALMGDLLTAEQQTEVAVAITVAARKHAGPSA
jgi:arsenite methyltransferase